MSHAAPQRSGLTARALAPALTGCHASSAPAPHAVAPSGSALAPPDAPVAWMSAHGARIHRAWNGPAEVSPDLTRAAPHAGVLWPCNADAVARESRQAAVRRAAPAPAPPDPSMFDPNLVMIFTP
jgi:hypothetical protein